MKKFWIMLIGSIYIVFVFSNTNVIAEASEKIIVYFYSENKDEGIENIEVEGIKVKYYDVKNKENRDLFHSYMYTYNVRKDEQKLPLVFSGDQYFSDINDEDIIENANNSLKTLAGNQKLIVYFYSPTCVNCQEVKPYIESLVEDGVYVIYYDVTNLENVTLFKSYLYAYSGKSEEGSTPTLFSGSKFYDDKDEIIDNINNNTIQENASTPLKSVDVVDEDLGKYDGLLGFLLILVAGLIDGVNPCAIAMLVLFISLILGLSTKKSILISVSISYILGLFLTYFALGAFLLSFLKYLEPFISSLSLFIYIFIVLISLFFFFFNLYDFIVSRKQLYGKVKNQLPKGIQKFNKKLIKAFTNNLENKNLFLVYMIVFLLGVVISLTEFLCTGQVYLPTLLIIVHSQDTINLSGLFKLFLYNVMFILPLITISFLAVKTQSVMGTSDKIRRNLHKIKFVTGLIFLAFAIYYLYKIIEVI